MITCIPFYYFFYFLYSFFVFDIRADSFQGTTGAHTGNMRLFFNIFLNLFSAHHTEHMECLSWVDQGAYGLRRVWEQKEHVFGCETSLLLGYCELALEQ